MTFTLVGPSLWVFQCQDLQKTPAPSASHARSTAEKVTGDARTAPSPSSSASAEGHCASSAKASSAWVTSRLNDVTGTTWNANSGESVGFLFQNNGTIDPKLFGQVLSTAEDPKQLRCLEKEAL